MTPAELVQQLDGCLRVTPADQLTPADLEVLTTHKPAILAVLAAPATVV